MDASQFPGASQQMQQHFQQMMPQQPPQQQQMPQPGAMPSGYQQGHPGQYGMVDPSSGMGGHPGQMGGQPQVTLMLVNVPHNVRSGENLVVMTPSGQQYMVVVPPGAGPGSQFQIAVPRNDN